MDAANILKPALARGELRAIGATTLGEYQKYIEKDMYTGTVERGDKGFMGYNTHNEFLEALLQTGIIGGLIFLLICWSLIKMAWHRKKAELSFVTLLLLIYSFSESVFETQYSLLIFIFFPLFFYLETARKTAHNVQTL